MTFPSGSKQATRWMLSTKRSRSAFPYQQFQALRLLLIRLSGSLAVLVEVNFFFIPSILAQKESRRLPPSGWGGFKFIPSFFAEARPLAFKPPFGFLPSFLCHAGLLAMINYRWKLSNLLAKPSRPQYQY